MSHDGPSVPALQEGAPLDPPQAYARASRAPPADERRIHMLVYGVYELPALEVDRSSSQVRVVVQSPERLSTGLWTPEMR